MADSELRERLIDVATGLFAEKGFAGTSVREIVQAAGSTKPTLYYYFDSKEGLLAAVVEHHLSTWVLGLEALKSAPLSVLDRLEQWIDSVLQSSANQRPVMLFLMRCHLEAFHGAESVDFSAFQRGERQTLCMIVEEGIAAGELRPHDPEDSVCALMGMLHFQLMATLEGRNVPPDAAKRMLAVYLKGVGT